MKGRTLAALLVTGVLIVAAAAAIWWFSRTPSPETQPVTQEMRGRSGVAEASSPSAPASSRRLERSSVRREDGHEPAVEVTVADALQRHRGLFEDVPPMGPDAARALVARRRQEASRLQSALAARGRAGVDDIRDNWARAKSTREKLMLAGALERNSDPAATALLAELLEGEEGFTVREALVKSLARSQAPGDRAELLRLLADPEPRLRVAAAQGLHGRPESLGEMARLVREDANMVVRLEAIGTISSIDTPAARRALQDIATGELEPRVRQFAQKALKRMTQHLGP